MATINRLLCFSPAKSLTKNLPAGTDSIDYWTSLPNGQYYYYSGNGVFNTMPLSSDKTPYIWGFVIKMGTSTDFIVLFISVTNGKVFLKSGNSQTITNWKAVSLT